VAILTGDAPLADRALGAAQRDCVFRLKKTPLTLYPDGELVFAQKREPACVRVEKGHGRRERRAIRTSGDLAGSRDFPGLRPVAEIRTRGVFLKTGVVREDTHSLLTSLEAERAGPARLLSLMRGQWGIANTLLHVKDDGFREDRHVLGSHRSGAVMSPFRGAALNLRRGRSRLWEQEEPLPGRAQAVSAQPLAILGAIL